MEINLKILDNFEPYNDIYYKSCFFHGFFPVVKHFNREIQPFIANNVFIYKYDDAKTGVKFELKVIDKNDIEKILENMGISMITKIESFDIIGDLITSIDMGNPVIICIDCYYESIRLDAYQMNHWPHSLLIHGYNNAERIFYIIEHRYRDSYLFEKRTISYSDIMSSYDGYITNLHEDKKYPSFFEFTIKCNDKSSKKNCYFKRDTYVNTFLVNLQDNKKAIFDGIEDIKLFANDYKQIVLEESILKANVDDLLNILNDIVNNKNLERYCILKVFNSKLNSISLCESIINNWCFIRGIIGKYKFSSQYNLKSFEKSIEKLNEIYELECHWYCSLFC